MKGNKSPYESSCPELVVGKGNRKNKRVVAREEKINEAELK